MYLYFDLKFSGMKLADFLCVLEALEFPVPWVARYTAWKALSLCAEHPASDEHLLL